MTDAAPLDFSAHPHRLLTRRQALEAGFGRGTIAHLLGPRGRWQRVLPQVFAMHRGPLPVETTMRAAVLYGGPGSMIGGRTAARVHGLRAVGAEDAVDLLLPHRYSRRSTDLVRIRRALVMPSARWADGLPLVSVQRAVIDACRDLQQRSEVRALAAEAVQRNLTTVDRLEEELDRGGSAGSRHTRAVLAEVRGGARSAAEGMAMELIRGTGLPSPLWNRDLRLASGRWLARPDAYWPEVGVAWEIDSRRWHLGPEAWERTMLRHGAMTAAGLVVVHTAPTRIRDRPHEVVAELHAAMRAHTGRPLPDVTWSSTPR